MPVPIVKQFVLSAKDRERLKALIRDDYSQDSADLQVRNKALKRWYQLWRNAQLTSGFPEESSTFSIPFILWNILAKLSKELDVLLGEESEIVVTPIGKTDVSRNEKVSRWMNWRVKVSLQLFKKLYAYLLQKLVFGTSIGFLPWATKKRMVKVLETIRETVQEQTTDPISGLPAIIDTPVERVIEREKEVVDFDGPDFQVEELEDWIVPKNAIDIESADHFIRRTYVSTDDLLDMRDEGKLDAKILTKELIEQFRSLAKTGGTSASDTTSGIAVKQEKDIQEGLPVIAQGREEEIALLNWLGRFRLDKDERSTEIVAFYQSDKNELLGVCRLIDIYPDGRRPFIHSQAIMDVKRFWGIGMAELLEPIQREMDAIHNLAISAGEGAIGPLIVASPTSGFNPENTKYEAFSILWTSDPNSVKAINLGQINLAPYVLFMQQFLAFGERLTGLTDPQMGRQFDRPNAPRTFGQQAMLQQESNVRLLLDMRLERENLKMLLRRIWEMDKRFLSKPVFFRVTEEQAEDVLTEEDMQGEYDFDIGPVTAISNRAQKMQESLQAFALAQPLGFPPVTLALFKKILQKLGHADVAALLPEPKEMQPPMSPQEEETRVLQGETVEPSPMSNHDEHIAHHQATLQNWQKHEIMDGISFAQTNPQALTRLQVLIAKHEQLKSSGGFSGMQMNRQGAGNLPQAGEAVSNLNPQQQIQGQLAALVNQGGANLA